MNRWMLAPMFLLLSGAMALPALAQEPGEPGYEPSARQERGREFGEMPQRDETERANAPAFGRTDRGQPRQSDGRGQIGRGEPGDLGTPAAWPVVRQDTARDDRDDGRHGRGWQGRDDGRDSDRYDDRRDARYEPRYDDRRDARYEPRYDDRREVRFESRYDDRSHGHDRGYYARHDDRRWRGNYWYPQYRHRAPARYVHPYGYRPYQWRVGHRLPASYYHRNYYVDYRAYRLPPPPYGYYWVRVDRDVVLVAAATGLIRDILYGLYF